MLTGHTFGPIAIWLTIGGIRDLKSFFQHLAKVKRNELDDGTVVNHHNVVDENIE